MTTVSASIIMVSKESLAHHSENEIASAIGHELIHVNDDLRGELDRFDVDSANQSERRGYNWQWTTRRDFSLNYRYKEFITRELAKLESGATP